MRTEFNQIDNEGKVYFIADIAANHDGKLERALSLIELAAINGANAAKFQNFKAETIVSKSGFDKDLKKKLSHQEKWSKSVFEVYKEAELPIDWTEQLIAKCNEMKIDYFTAPYDLQYVDLFENKMPFYKIGSGDITYKQIIEKIADKGKPVFLATGASSGLEVDRAVQILEKAACEYVLMQCNTNYTGSKSNFSNINLNVLKTYREKYPRAILGLSDHTAGLATVLGAVSLGAKVIEKHFTDDIARIGPDHGFSMDPNSWKQMVDETRNLEMALGDGIKKVEENEVEARIIQRRAIRTSRKLSAGHILTERDLVALRPIPKDGIEPFRIQELIGKRLKFDLDEDVLMLLDFVVE